MAWYRLCAIALLTLWPAVARAEHVQPAPRDVALTVGACLQEIAPVPIVADGQRDEEWDFGWVAIDRGSGVPAETLLWFDDDDRYQEGRTVHYLPASAAQPWLTGADIRRCLERVLGGG